MTSGEAGRVGGTEWGKVERRMDWKVPYLLASLDRPATGERPVEGRAPDPGGRRKVDGVGADSMTSFE